MKRLLAAVPIACIFLASCEFLTFLKSTKTFSGSGGAVESGYNYFPVSADDTGSIVSIDEVTLDGFIYPTASDLTISIQKVGGSTVTLVSQKGNANDYISDYIFVDDTDVDGLPRIVTWSGDVVPETYQAEGDFDDFNGDELKGTWRLVIFNSSPTTGGNLNSWSIQIQYEEE
jgi:hypothetical protein